MKFEYIVQPSPDGLAQAFILGKNFIGNDNVCLILGDNIFYGNDMTRLLNKPFISKKNENQSNVGDLTKKFIEENREVLEQQKKEIKEQTYDES